MDNLIFALTQWDLVFFSSILDRKNFIVIVIRENNVPNIKEGEEIQKSSVTILYRYIQY